MRPPLRVSNPNFSEALTMLPSKSDTTVCCAHPAYQIHDELVARNSGIRSFQVRERDELPDRISEADVLVISGFWRNELLEGVGRRPSTRRNCSGGAGRHFRGATRGKLAALADVERVHHTPYRGRAAQLRE